MSNILTEKGCDSSELAQVIVINEYGLEYFDLKTGAPEEFQNSNRKFFKEGSQILMYVPHAEKPGKDKLITRI